MSAWWLPVIVAAIAALITSFVFRRLRAGHRLVAEADHARAELSRRLNELFSLQELSYALSQSLEIDRIAEQVVRYVARFIESDGTLVALATEGETRLRVAAAQGSLSKLSGVEVTERDAGLVGAAMGGEHLEVAESEDDQRPLLLAGVDVRRAIAAPLRAHGATVGTVAVVSEQPGAFSQEDLRLLSTVAMHAAITLANARLVDLIRRGKEQWETTFDALRDGIAVVDQHGAIRRANPALARLLRKPFPEILGRNLAGELLDRSLELVGLFEAVRDGETRGPLSRRFDSIDRVLRISASPMRGGVTEGWVVALVEDVTEQKAMEQQLIQTEKMAAVGQLVSGVAHELNNPLTSIVGLSEFLLEQPAGSEQDREHLNVIHEQAERAAQIVRNLLTFARKGPTDVASVDLNDVVRRAAALISYELRLREIEFEVHLAEDLPPVRGDRYQIQQVVLNLVTNAVQAVGNNPPDRPRIVRVHTATKDHRVILRVTDSGPGIPENLVPQIFTPFFTTKDPGHGTGLGLSITFGIVEGHGGSISVERGLDGGAAFVVNLAAARARPGSQGLAPLGERSDASPAPHTAGPSAPPAARERVILLVDDDPAVRRMIGTLFAENLQRVESARNALHAAELLRHHTYDLILADPLAAGSAGRTFGDMLCSQQPKLKDRTVFLTSDVRPETDEWLRKLGCRYLRKPFNIRELRLAATAILEHTEPTVSRK
jgi:two-component system NtrC family sensor kinase